MGATLVLMLPALTPPQRAGMLAGLRAEAPPEAFQGTLALAAPDWAKLSRALGLVPVPGLVAS